MIASYAGFVCLIVLTIIEQLHYVFYSSLLLDCPGFSTKKEFLRMLRCLDSFHKEASLEESLLIGKQIR